MGAGSVQRARAGCVAFAMLLIGARAAGETQVVPTLRLSAEERYDDDALLRSSPQGAGQMITKLSPQIGLNVSDETLETGGWYAADFLFRHGSHTTDLDHRAAYTFDKKFSRTFELDSHLNFWRVSDPTALPRLGMARSLSPIMYGRGQVSAKIGLSERLWLHPGYRFEGAKIYEPGRPGGTAHTPFVELWYRITRRADLGAEYRFQYFGFGPQSADANGIFAAYRYRLARHTVFTAHAGPVFFREYATGGNRGFLPMVQLELTHGIGGRFDIGLAIGHDIVGATGFTNVLWADYGSLALSYKISEPFRIFGAAAYFRNGFAPNNDWTAFNFGTPRAGTSQGYSVGGGLEWRASSVVSVQGAFERFDQVAAPDALAGVNLSRNIGSIRLVLTAL